MPPASSRHAASPPARSGALPLLAFGWMVGLLMLLASPHAQAVPSFARQTGSSCADCHAASYGPSLTPYGMRFKLNGYTDSDGNGLKIPVAGQVTGARSIPATGKATTQLTEADLYLAGRVSDHVGGYIKVASNNTGNDKFDTRLTEMDLRFVTGKFKIGGKDAMVGVTVNNNPGAQDPIGILPAASTLGPASAYGTSTSILNSSSLSRRTLGTSLYGVYDRNWYGELGTYRSMPTSLQDRFGYPISGDPGKLSGTRYMRLAYMRDLRSQFFSVGVTALNTKQQRPRTTGPTNEFTDIGYDLSYQLLGSREHMLSLGYVNIYERRRYGDPLISGALNPALTPRRRGSIRDQTLSLNYTFQQSYGVLLAHMINTGSDDPARYVPYGVPDTTTNLISAYWTPFGKDGGLTSIANMRLSATWFRFSRFNGVSDDLFGTLPAVNARDFNQFQVALSLAF